jgi:hypothetical protein
MKIVKFKDGRYAIRKGNCLFGYSYYGIEGDYCSGNWWNHPKDVEKYSKTECLETVKRWFAILTDYGRPL